MAQVTAGVLGCALLGLVVGSFLNVVVYRLPRGEQVVRGRSRCPACGAVLAWYDLVPVLSYLVLRGRCRSCRTPISPRYLVVELATGLLSAALFVRFGFGLGLAKYLYLAWLLVAATFIDLEHYLIPDKLVLAGLLGGLLFSALERDPGFWAAVALGLGTGLFFLLVALASKGGMGGGDVKLAALISFYLGWPLGLLAVFFGVCLGGAGALLLLALGRKKRKDALPFGPFLALGALAALFWGEEFLAWYLGRLLRPGV